MKTKKNMTLIDENVGNEEFSKVLFCLVEQYNNTYDEIGKKLKESAHTILRKWCDLQTPVLFSNAACDLIEKESSFFEHPGFPSAGFSRNCRESGIGLSYRGELAFTKV